VLPAATRSVLLAAAANDASALAEALAAASALEGKQVTVGVLAPAVAARLVEVSGTELRFRHPLVRSAIYQASAMSRRHAAHAALAEVTVGQPDRQAWHRAAAALGPDERVAADLEAAATRALRRGAVTVAIDALRRAAQLSEDPENRGRRLVAAAEDAYESGRPELGSDLLQTAEPLDLPADVRTWLAYEREIFGEAGWSGAAKVESFVGLADRMRAAGHARIAADALQRICMRCYWGNPPEEIRAAVTAAADRIKLPDDDPAMLEILAMADPVRHGRVVNERIARMTADPGNPGGMYCIGAAATAVWAWDRSLTFLDVAVATLRAQGRRGVLAAALVVQAWAGVHLARAPLAMSAADEAARLASENRQPLWAAAARLAQAAVAGERGNTEAAAGLLRAGESVLSAAGANPMLGLAQFARGRAAVTSQRYAEGLAHLRRILDPADPVYHPFAGTWGLADLVEAAVHVGEAAAARAYLDQLESLAGATAGPLLLAEAAYARPLAAAAEDAEALYQAALADGLADWPGYRARMLLSYGRWLRRQRRAVESRAPLREARDSFDVLGFANLAEQTRRELRAAGESSGPRTPRPWDELTPQELQIARMAARGMSNREIAEQLYVSHRTVSGALYRIFPKLGITSRSQLHAAIPA
jgi:DNA-binding CsgD family transcriptional regulator